MFSHISVRLLARKLQSRFVQRATKLIGPFAMAQKRRLLLERQIIGASLLFDRNWYLQTYSDVAQAGIDPLHHYLTVGWHEGRDPGPMFTTSAYLKANEDVAKSGMSPLLHFVQFGRAEGRDGFGQEQFPPSGSEEQMPLHDNRTLAEFARAHECLSGPRARPDPPVWLRWYRLDRNDPRFVRIGSFGAGYRLDSDTDGALQTAAEWLRVLSGCSAGDLPRESVPAGPADFTLVDAWYANSSQLRTRWDGRGLPLVLRAFQCDPLQGGQPQLVGEGAVVTPVDFVDMHLLNPYFPVLFVLAKADGFIHGAEMLTFPSLCRGGLHYPELLCASARGSQRSPAVRAVSQELTQKLICLIGGEAQAAVGQVQVNLSPAHLDGPLFRQDLLQWLGRVLQVDIVSSGSPRSLGCNSEVFQSSRTQAAISRDGGASLNVRADTMPTIASLVALRTSLDDGPAVRPLPLLVSRMDPSRPVLCVEVPSEAAQWLRSRAGVLPWLLSTANGGVPADFPPAAIRFSSKQQLSDADLLVPIMAPAGDQMSSRAAITWLIHAQDENQEHLVQALQTAALQRLSEKDVVAIVGQPADASLRVARKLFPGRAATFKTSGDAILQIKTPLVGYLGNGVLLHDHNTADCFASMLSLEQVTTASCVIVSAEKRAGTVKTMIIDGGAWAKMDGNVATASECADAAAEIWQSSYPVLRPSRHLWAARTSALMAATDEGAARAPGSVIHLCSSAVTATCLNPGAAAAHLARFPAACDTSGKAEWLFG
jgi:hypothetical protein